MAAAVTPGACNHPTARWLLNGCVCDHGHVDLRPGGSRRERAPSLQHLWTVCQRRRRFPRGVVVWPALPLDEVLASCGAGEREVSVSHRRGARNARVVRGAPPARPGRSEIISSTSYSSSSISATLCLPRWPAGRTQPSHTVHAPTHTRGVGWTLLDVLIRTSAWDTGKTQLRGGKSRKIHICLIHITSQQDWWRSQGLGGATWVGGRRRRRDACTRSGRGRRERRGEAAPPPPGARGAMREKQRRGHRGSLDLAVAPVTPY